METRPQKYGEPTTITSITLPVSVKKELDSLCEKEGTRSRSEYVTRLIHRAYLDQNDPILSINRMEERQQELELEQQRFQADCQAMYGRSLEEQKAHIAAMARQREIEAQAKIKDQRDRERLYGEKRQQVQTALTDYFTRYMPDQRDRPPLGDVLREEELLEAWRAMPTDQRGRLLDRAQHAAGLRRDDSGQWRREPVVQMYR